MTPSPWSFSFEPLYLVLAVVALVLYVRAWRHAPGPTWRALCFGAGLLLVVGALNSPLGTIATEYLVLFHLLQNVMISDWAPPLLLIGLTPAMRAGIAAGGGRAFATLTRPELALPIWLVGWYVVHLGAVYDAAVRSTVLLAAEHGFLIAIGLLFWWPVLCDVPRAVSTLVRLAYVFAAFVLSAFLGLALTFSPPIYDYYESLPGAALGHLGRAGSEPRRDPDVDRAGARLLRRDRLAPRPSLPGGGRGGAAARCRAARRGAA